MIEAAAYDFCISIRVVSSVWMLVFKSFSFFNWAVFVIVGFGKPFLFFILSSKYSGIMLQQDLLYLFMFSCLLGVSFEPFS